MIIIILVNRSSFFNLFNSDLNTILAESRNFAEVTWAWKIWRDTVGPPNLDKYAQYVVLKNKAAVLNGKYRVFFHQKIYDSSNIILDCGGSYVLCSKINRIV